MILAQNRCVARTPHLFNPRSASGVPRQEQEPRHGAFRGKDTVPRVLSDSLLRVRKGGHQTEEGITLRWPKGAMGAPPNRVLEYAHAWGADHGRGCRGIRQIHPVRAAGAASGSRGLEVVRTSEPDGTPLGAAGAGLFEAAGPTPTPLTQTFLFMAARQEHVTRVIAPALARGAVVISDRYADATVAYQGYGQGMDVQTIRELNMLATGGVVPDLTLRAGSRSGRGHAAHPRARARRLREDGHRPSTAACARAISRSRGPTRIVWSCWTPTAIRTRSHADVVRAVDECWRGVEACVALDAIRDQAEAVTLLRRAIASERVAHAYAFVGPEGSGRKATALAFAAALVRPGRGPPPPGSSAAAIPTCTCWGRRRPRAIPRARQPCASRRSASCERRASLKPAEAA